MAVNSDLERKIGNPILDLKLSLKWQQNILIRGGRFTFSNMCKNHIEITLNTPRTGSVTPQQQTHTKGILTGCPAVVQVAFTSRHISASLGLSSVHPSLSQCISREGLPWLPRFLIWVLFPQCLCAFLCLPTDWAAGGLGALFTLTIVYSLWGYHQVWPSKDICWQTDCYCCPWKATTLPCEVKVSSFLGQCSEQPQDQEIIFHITYQGIMHAVYSL